MVKQIFSHKIFLLLLLSLLLMVPVQSIMELNRERQAYRSQAIHSIMASSSGPQRLLGPVVVQPYTRTVTVEQDGKRFERKLQLYRYLLPEQLDVRASMQVTPRKLGIYQAQVYHSRLSLSGRLPAELNGKTLISGEPDLTVDGADPALVAGKPYLSLVLSDARGINRVPELQLGEQRIPFAPGALLGDGLAGIHAPLAALPGADGAFHIELDLQGMNQLEVVPLGQDSRLNLASNWPHPNFIGDFLPGSRTLTSRGFEASWQSSWFATDMESRFNRMMKGARGDLPAFSVSLVQPVDHYQQNERAAKYALLFIGLTFLSFFMFELLKGLRVHPIQYALVGMGLAIFYLVLLALTEHLGFAWAYLIAALASVALNGFYLSHVLGGPKQGLGFAALLGLVYAILFGLLQAEEIALLLGALLLFAILALVMVLTRKLDWYRVMGNAPTPPANGQES
ncbi:cell envelope integrity protein CreD [Aeromonas hydrophila]|uniref:cell envelope integrity protein CreD n=1 Tax=Aeromonas hydrophila TaxID=644 RepID=UPI00191EC1D1|nr:cell envelope integrity protein CreD [Aeromonas hydrophila]MBL0435464.1 cell envelope integrity protein CreD [Aeromonas hydrophila]MBL0471309.1 cell envelope integrity protein CreD [Aeromonas hydrophila]MBQ4668835.1 cell envelope integrity protein CreD [Aeromonas hydrophila]MBQ4717039.1 cell envelope integrity protein CreD [Aeromonas hydrophila]MBW3825916.1 cell envelope integrity protein CreD [Aeromonas hydrophila]